jgi:SAM-dependent methyltransferase
MMREEEYHDNFYETEASQIFESALFAEVRRRVVGFLGKQIIYSPKEYVLSLGSGDGNLDIQMAPLVGKILGVEISEMAVKQAKEKAKLAQVNNVDFQVGDIQKMSFPPNSFDVIWAPAVLHHIDDIQIAELLQNSLSCLKPGGTFISLDPSSRRFVGLFKKIFDEKYKKYHSPDERELDIKKIRKSFQRAGFSSVTIHYTDYFLGPLAWLFPNFPRAIVPLAAALDSLLLLVPIVQLFASSFAVVAHK